MVQPLPIHTVYRLSPSFAKILPVAPHGTSTPASQALGDLPTTSPTLPSTLYPFSLCFSHNGLPAILAMLQISSQARAFAYAVSFAWKALLHRLFLHLLSEAFPEILFRILTLPHTPWPSLCHCATLFLARSFIIFCYTIYFYFKKCSLS